MTKDKKVAAIAILAALGGALVGGVVGPILNPNEVIVKQEVVKTVEIPGPLVTETVEVEKVVEVPVEVPVEDLTFVQQACDRLVYDDVEECKEEVAAEDEAIALAIEKIKEDFADEIEDADIIDDEDDVELIKVYDDYEDIVVKESDFDDEEYKFDIQVKVEDDDTDKKKKVIFTVEVESGDARILKVKEI